MRRVLFYTTFLPLAIVYIAFSFLELLPVALLALFAVISHGFARYEYWAFKVPNTNRDHMALNDPRLISFKKVFRLSWERASHAAIWTSKDRDL